MRTSIAQKSVEHRTADEGGLPLSFAAKRTLATLPILHGSRQGTLSEMVRAAKQMRVPKRTLVYAPKDECTGLYVILDGEIKLIGPKKKGREKVIALLGRNHWFGETALILRQRHISGAKTADTATTLLHLPRSVVLDCLNQDHAFALRLLSATCERLHSSMLDAERLATPPLARVIGFLLEQVPSSIVTGPVTITLSVPKRAIASRLNISPEHLSRVFGRLADAQMIEVDGPHVLIYDVAHFRKAASTSRAR